MSRLILRGGKNWVSENDGRIGAHNLAKFSEAIAELLLPIDEDCTKFVLHPAGNRDRQIDPVVRSIRVRVSDPPNQRKHNEIVGPAFRLHDKTEISDLR